MFCNHDSLLVGVLYSEIDPNGFFADFFGGQLVNETHLIFLKIHLKLSGQITQEFLNQKIFWAIFFWGGRNSFNFQTII